MHGKDAGKFKAQATRHTMPSTKGVTDRNNKHKGKVPSTGKAKQPLGYS